MPPIKLALLSDIHVHDGSPQGSEISYIGTNTPEDSGKIHPITGLIALNKIEKLSVDFVLCGGDIADKAQPSAQQYAWAQLQILREAMGASGMIATSGNHDVDSRFAHNSFDAKGHLQSLVPKFPGLAEQECDRYWSRNFVIRDFDNWRLLLLNSAAYHGGGKNKEEEYARGRVSDHTLLAIQAELESIPPKQINILLCHHHPIRNDEIRSLDYSEMELGDRLMNLLGDSRFGHWLVIHGHKHYPRIWRAGGSSDAPVIFSLGSFSRKLDGPFAGAVRNQFYYLEIDPDVVAHQRMGIVGTFRAWDWFEGLGWLPAKPDSGLPSAGGFGARSTTDALAHRLAHAIEISGQPYIKWSELLSAEDEFQFVAPKDLSAVFLKAHKLGVQILYDGNGIAVQLGKPLNA